MIVVSEFGLVLCLTLCMGFALCGLIFEDLDVKREVCILWLKVMGNASILFAFLTIVLTALTFSDRFQLDFMRSLFQVLYGTNVGIGWVCILGMNTLLLGLISFFQAFRPRFFSYFVVLIAVGMLISYAYSRHVSSLDPVWGFLSQSIHVLGVAVWLGLLLVFSWFSGERVNWIKVFKWFTPLSIACMTAIVVAGLFVMKDIAPEYVQSWILTYGQALLVKHLLMFPLLTFAFINGFLYRFKIKKDPDFNPKPWLRAESLLAIVILLVTAFMSEQAPPHQVASTLLNEKPSSWFLYWHPGSIIPGHSFHIVLNTEGLLLLLMSGFMLFLVGLCYYKLKRLPVVLVAFTVLLGSISAYMAAMIMVR